MRRTAWTAVAGSVLALGGGAVGGGRIADTGRRRRPGPLVVGRLRGRGRPRVRSAPRSPSRSTTPTPSAARSISPSSGCRRRAIARGRSCSTRAGPGGSGYDFAANAASAIDQRVRARASLRPRRLRPPRRAALGRHRLRRRRHARRHRVPRRHARHARGGAGARQRRRPSSAPPARRRYGDTLRFYSTTNTARDMDAIRAALGDEQISYLGISATAPTSAASTPGCSRSGCGRWCSTRRSSRAATASSTSGRRSSIGFEHAFDNWAAWCQAGNDCAFTAPDVGARWDALLGQPRRQPAHRRRRPRGQPGRARDGDDRGDVQQGRSGRRSARRSPTPRPATAPRLLALADSYNERNPDGTYDTIYQSFQVIRCASGLGPTVPDRPRGAARPDQGGGPALRPQHAHRRLRRRLHAT